MTARTWTIRLLRATRARDERDGGVGAKNKDVPARAPERGAWEGKAREDTGGGERERWGGR